MENPKKPGVEEWSSENTETWQTETPQYLNRQAELKNIDSMRQDILVFDFRMLGHIPLVTLLQSIKESILKNSQQPSLANVLFTGLYKETPVTDEEIVESLEALMPLISDESKIREIHALVQQHTPLDKALTFEVDELPGEWLDYSGKEIVTANSASMAPRTIPDAYPALAGHYNVHNGVVVACDRVGVMKVAPESGELIEQLEAANYQRGRIMVPSLIQHPRGAITTFTILSVQKQWEALVAQTTRSDAFPDAA